MLCHFCIPLAYLTLISKKQDQSAEKFLSGARESKSLSVSNDVCHRNKSRQSTGCMIVLQSLRMTIPQIKTKPARKPRRWILKSTFYGRKVFLFQTYNEDQWIETIWDLANLTTSLYVFHGSKGSHVSYAVLKEWFSKCSRGPTASKSPGNLLKIQIFVSHPDLPDQKLWKGNLTTMVFTSLLGDCSAR